MSLQHRRRSAAWPSRTGSRSARRCAASRPCGTSVFGDRPPSRARARRSPTAGRRAPPPAGRCCGSPRASTPVWLVTSPTEYPASGAKFWRTRTSSPVRTRARRTGGAIAAVAAHWGPARPCDRRSAGPSAAGETDSPWATGGGPPRRRAQPRPPPPRARADRGSSPRRRRSDARGWSARPGRRRMAGSIITEVPVNPVWIDRLRREERHHRAREDRRHVPAERAAAAAVRGARPHHLAPWPA